MGEKDNNNKNDGLGLGLSLSLGLGGFQDQSSLHFNLMQQQQEQDHHHHHHHHGGVFPSFDHGTQTRTHLKIIDMNVAPPPPPPPPPPSNSCDEDVGVSSPNSTISSTSGKRSEREANNNNNNGDDNTDEEDGEGGRKKLRLSKEQAALLEETFKEHNTLNPKQKLALAKQLTLRPRQVEVWFQNRRARTKLKQTEVDCEYLKRCCENLTVENRRLQKEVADLRALKHAPQFYMNMTPPTTLTMCPSCEKVAPFSAVATSQHNQASTTTIKRPIPINAWASKSMHATRL